MLTASLKTLTRKAETPLFLTLLHSNQLAAPSPCSPCSHPSSLSTGYGGGSSHYPFMPITDPSHTFHSASSSGHHVTEEHVIEEDEKDEIDSQDDIDDNENMDEEDDEPLFDIAMVNNTEIEYEPLLING
ncbi:hypothetical protein Taro_038518 [Colocasia esculenta]|uniref:Uncharacterized protein n=1 Tax=Colocasia esculenta TaxID=4460 RepID=A0A843WNX4_COLES|nr:hypothetical protein [Colocasia esculenta]